MVILGRESERVSSSFYRAKQVLRGRWGVAQWFAENFAFKYPQEALDLLRRKNMILSWVIWHAIAQVLFQKKPGGSVLSRWVPVLIATALMAP